jgi:hypothetical protein
LSEDGFSELAREEQHPAVATLRVEEFVGAELLDMVVHRGRSEVELGREVALEAGRLGEVLEDAASCRADGLAELREDALRVLGSPSHPRLRETKSVAPTRARTDITGERGTDLAGASGAVAGALSPST